ncbi:NAD(+) diphosphatase [Actinocrispum sp. NPDC049592]|uniref:NAD(+) diphosphatase n=1 Tax=Actinocrispum sp. NPDC049592 TaxID=3154835 RepID=UPI0034465C89
MRPFELDALPLLSRSTVVREENLREDVERQLELWQDGRVIVLDPDGRTPIGEQGTLLAHRDAKTFGSEPPPEALLLGEDGGHGWWAIPVDYEVDRGGLDWRSWQVIPSLEGEQWLDLRMAGSFLEASCAGLFTTAVALTSWHKRARFCANCGSPVLRVKAGWATQCTGCGREEYPRTDPAVICLVHDRPTASRVLLARQPIWPKGRYSVLAGFVEAGESLEACVAREIAEEVGVTVDDIRYLGSQPWPFPRSLMLGFAASADPEQQIRLQDGEIEEARWVDRAEVKIALAAEAAGEDHWLGLPGPTSIARRMLESWTAA